MKQPMPWSVKGVDAEARETAKEAARRAGMTLGEWLNAMIAENAAESEREEREATMAEIADRLARLDRTSTSSLPRSPSGNDLESVLRRAMSESRHQAHAVEERTASALDSMMRWMERNEGRRRDEIGAVAAATERTSTALRDALGLVSARMDQIERTVTANDSQGLRRAIERLESRIEKLDSRTAAEAPSPRIEASLRELEGRLVALADRMGEPGPTSAHAERIARIEDSLGSILERLDGVGARKPVDVAPGSIEDAISQIRARQAVLDREDALPTPEAVSELVTRSLKGDIDQLARRLEDLRGRDDKSAFAELRGDLAELASAVRSIDPDDRLASVERGLASLGRYVEDLRAMTPRGDDLRQPIEALTADIVRMGRSLDPLRDVAALRADIASLMSRVDSAQEEPDGPTAADIAREIAALRKDVETAVAQALPVESLERRLEGITGILEQIAAHRGDADIAALRETTQDVRSLVAAMPDFREVERRFETIADRLNTATTEAVRDPSLQAFPLDELVARLGEKLQEARGPQATPGSFDALEKQISAMTDALGRTDESFASIQSLERSVTALFAKLEETAKASASTAEEAAERAARQVADSLAETIARAGETGGRAQEPEPATQQALTTVQSALDRIIDKLAAMEADLVAGRGAGSTEAVDTGPLAPASKVEKAAAATAVAEKIAAAAAAAKAAKTAELPKSRPVQVTVRKAEAVRVAATPVPPAAAPGPALPASDNDLLAAAAKAAAQSLLASLEPQNGPASAVSREETIQPFALDTDVPGEAAPAGKPARDDEFAHDLASLGLADGGTLSLDLPLEPGSGRPVAPEVRPVDVSEPASDAAPEVAPKTSFIAAAREAVLASQSGRKGKKAERQAATVETIVADAALGKARSGSIVERTRRPILIGLGVVVLALGAAHVVRNALTGGTPPVQGVDKQGLEKPSGGPAPSAPSGSEAPADPARQSALPADPSTTGALPPQKAPDKMPVAPAAPDMPSSLLAPDSGGKPSGFAPARGTGEPAGTFQPGQGAAAPAPLVDPATVPIPPMNDLARALLPASLVKAATGGNPAAAYELAVRLQEGKGVPRDPKLAMRWFERAGLLGLAPAQYRLGSLYEKGVGVPVDLVQARLWYERAAARGNAKAMHNLGVLSADGSGGKPDYAAAATWFRKAADLGVRDSQYNLAILAARGLGMQQNLTESYMWFSLAAAQGDEDAGRKREDVAARLDPAALASAKAAAAGFKPQRQDEAANDVTPPPGGWDEPTAAQKEKAKSVRS